MQNENEFTPPQIITYDYYVTYYVLPEVDNVAKQKTLIEKWILQCQDQIDTLCGNRVYDEYANLDLTKDKDKKRLYYLQKAICSLLEYYIDTGKAFIDKNFSSASNVPANINASSEDANFEHKRKDIIKMLVAGDWYQTFNTYTNAMDLNCGAKQPSDDFSWGDLIDRLSEVFKRLDNKNSFSNKVVFNDYDLDYCGNITGYKPNAQNKIKNFTLEDCIVPGYQIKLSEGNYIKINNTDPVHPIISADIDVSNEGTSENFISYLKLGTNWYKIAATSANYIELLGNEAVSHQPYHFPYHIANLRFDTSDKKLKADLMTITLDNNKTLTNYPLEVEIPAEPQVQSDWNQTDTTKADYIKNKPTNLVTTDTNQDIYATKTFRYSQYVYNQIKPSQIWMSYRDISGDPKIYKSNIISPSSIEIGDILTSTSHPEDNYYWDVTFYGNRITWKPAEDIIYTYYYPSANGTIALTSDILQSDWNQNDTSAKDYIKNKPTNILTTDTEQNITANKTFLDDNKLSFKATDGTDATKVEITKNGITADNNTNFTTSIDGEKVSVSNSLMATNNASLYYDGFKISDFGVTTNYTYYKNGVIHRTNPFGTSVGLNLPDVNGTIALTSDISTALTSYYTKTAADSTFATKNELQNGLATREAVDVCLPKAGGTMTGDIKISGGKSIYADSTNSQLMIGGGSSGGTFYKNGGEICLYGKDNSGAVRFISTDGSNAFNVWLKNSGVFQTEVPFVVPSSNGMTVAIRGSTTDASAGYVISSSDTSSDTSIWLRNKNKGGEVNIKSVNTSDSKTLTLRPDGTFTWNGKNVLTSSYSSSVPTASSGVTLHNMCYYSEFGKYCMVSVAFTVSSAKGYETTIMSGLPTPARNTALCVSDSNGNCYPLYVGTSGNINTLRNIATGGGLIFGNVTYLKANE